jgi:hypothetical protein
VVSESLYKNEIFADLILDHGKLSFPSRRAGRNPRGLACVPPGFPECALNDLGSGTILVQRYQEPISGTALRVLRTPRRES